ALGGADGAPNVVTVFRGQEAYTPLHLSKEQDIAITAGDRVRVRTPGGGGYGNPLDRAPADVLEDVRLARYTVAEAADLFAVVIAEVAAKDGAPSAWAVDEAATMTLRAQRREAA
ncbi:MAG: hydantoinase B/oxoprolinase family protein, partial [Pseudomonadota bacterium]